MKNNLITILSVLIFYFNGFAQPTPFPGTLLFNLVEKENTGKFINIAEFENRNIRLLSNYKDSKFKYDTIQKAFKFTTNGFEQKELALIYQNDTIFINYPSLRFVSAVFIKTPIPLNGKSFSFYNKNIYDAIHSNHCYDNFGIFYLCQGCSLSEQYEIQEKQKKQINKKYFLYEIELEK